jgi:hypothetical protein
MDITMRSFSNILIILTIVGCGGSAEKHLPTTATQVAKEKSGDSDLNSEEQDKVPDKIPPETSKTEDKKQTTENTSCAKDEIYESGARHCWQMCLQGTTLVGANCEGAPRRFLSQKKAQTVCQSYRNGCRLPTTDEISNVLDSCARIPIGKVCARMNEFKATDFAYWTSETAENKWSPTIDGVALFEIEKKARVGFYCVCQPK